MDPIDRTIFTIPNVPFSESARVILPVLSARVIRICDHGEAGAPALRKDCSKLDRFVRFISLWKLLSKSPPDRTAKHLLSIRCADSTGELTGQQHALGCVG